MIRDQLTKILTLDPYKKKTVSKMYDNKKNRINL